VPVTKSVVCNVAGGAPGGTVTVGRVSADVLAPAAVVDGDGEAAGVEAAGVDPADPTGSDGVRLQDAAKIESTSQFEVRTARSDNLSSRRCHVFAHKRARHNHGRAARALLPQGTAPPAWRALRVGAPRACTPPLA
jgi:hypothetical protein